jgi:hypothetical protein
MILLLIEPGSGRSSNTVSESRDKKIYDLLESEIEKKYYDEFLDSIGMIYEYVSKASPNSINSQPVFISCHYLSHSNTKKMFEYYDKYKELRKTVDNF